ncbi:MAG: hypothetical protein M3Z00_06760 [Actinomycetota bacterium]|nr:hypothetical protein [Actinomycetota bacterium]
MTTHQMAQTASDRQEIRRADDDELLGFVSHYAGAFRATTVFGGLLGEHPDADSAERQLRDSGLSSLAERWWIYSDDHWQRCWLIEASPERVIAVIATHAFQAQPQVVPAGTPLQFTEPAEG